MLDSLDTLIAFVLIMLVVSLLITIVVQMCAAALNLRGWNLLMGLKKTFAVIVPDAGQGQSPFAVIDLGREKQREELADYLLKGGFLSDSFLKSSWAKFWNRATAVRPSELFDALHRIAIGKEPADANLKANARGVLKALGVSEKILDAAEKEIADAEAKAKQISGDAQNALQSLLDLSEQITQALNTSNLSDEVKKKLEDTLKGDVKSRTESIQKAFENQIGIITNQVKAYGTAAAGGVVAAAGSIDAAYRKFEYWTCICQERAQQWLTMHTRMLTIFFAFIFAFCLQLDTVEIFKLVSSNKTLRDKLVAQATAVSSQAEKVLGNSPTVLQTAYDTWLRDVKDANVRSALTSPSPPPVKITTTDSRENVTNQIEHALGGIDKKPKEEALKSFNDTVDKTVTDDLKNKSRDYAQVQANFKDTGFELFPEAGRWPDGWSFAHVIGVLFSVDLLSLGAPFWYHALKDLVSLRSQVARNISDEQKQKEPGAASPSAPPTVKS